MQIKLLFKVNTELNDFVGIEKLSLLPRIKWAKVDCENHKSNVDLTERIKDEVPALKILKQSA